MVLVAFFRTWDDYLVGNMRLAFLRLPHASVPLSAASILGAAFFITLKGSTRDLKKVRITNFLLQGHG